MGDTEAAASATGADPTTRVGTRARRAARARIGPQAPCDPRGRRGDVPAKRLPRHEHGRARRAFAGVEADRVQALRQQGGALRRARHVDDGCREQQRAQRDPRRRCGGRRARLPPGLRRTAARRRDDAATPPAPPSRHRRGVTIPRARPRPLRERAETRDGLARRRVRAARRVAGCSAFPTPTPRPPTSTGSSWANP